MRFVETKRFWIFSVVCDDAIKVSAAGGLLSALMTQSGARAYQLAWFARLPAVFLEGNQADCYLLFVNSFDFQPTDTLSLHSIH